MAAKEKIISIKPKGITPKQYSALLLEINLIFNFSAASTALNVYLVEDIIIISISQSLLSISSRSTEPFN